MNGRYGDAANSRVHCYGYIILYDFAQLIFREDN